jgi:hypothetical protein
MSLQFNENEGIVNRRRPQKKSFSFIDFLITKGIVKNESQANIVLLIIALIGFGIIINMNMNTFAQPEPIDDTELYME